MSPSHWFRKPEGPQGVLIHEDIYNKKLERAVMSCVDHPFNLALVEHPGTYRRDSEWKGVFRCLNLDLTSVDCARFGIVGQASYVLEKRR